jgi:CarD family transcriptional regulator
MLDTARGLIVKEIAIARAQTEEDVKTEIEAIFFSN